MTTYQTAIREALARAGRIGLADPRHVEAYMRDERGTLDAVSPRAFDRLALDCAETAAADPALAERLAECMGLAR